MRPCTACPLTACGFACVHHAQSPACFARAALLSCWARCSRESRSSMMRRVSSSCHTACHGAGGGDADSAARHAAGQGRDVQALACTGRRPCRVGGLGGGRAIRVRSCVSTSCSLPCSHACRWPDLTQASYCSTSSFARSCRRVCLCEPAAAASPRLPLRRPAGPGLRCSPGGHVRSHVPPRTPGHAPEQLAFLIAHCSAASLHRSLDRPVRSGATRGS
jgi:hypothetical protein